MARNSLQTQHLQIGLSFEGKYRIVEELGRGGFGMVYLARQEQMDRHVAIKALKSGLGDERDAKAKKRFLREVRVISNLRHPNTVTIHDFGETDQGVLYMVLEYVKGESLDKILDREGAQRPERALHFATQIARSLGEAHRHGVVHRDLKPANIMITRLEGEGEFVKVLDFGVAGILTPDQPDLTVDGLPDEEDREILGTPRYMSPEQVRSDPIDGRADIYCLGLLLYEMLVGEPAVQGDTTMALITQQISPQPLELDALPALPPRIRNILRRATAKDIDRRYSSAENLVRDLREAATFLQRDSAGGADASASTSAEFGGQVVLDYEDQLNDLQEPQAARSPAGGSDELGPVQNHTPVPDRQTPAGQSGPAPTAGPGMPHDSQQANTWDSEMPPAPEDRDTFAPEQPEEPTQVAGADRAGWEPARSQPADAEQESTDPGSELLVDVLKLLVMGTLAAFGVYLAFVCVGAMMGELLDGGLRVAAALALSLAIPLLTALGETSQRERFRVVKRKANRVARVFIGTAIFGFGTAVLVSLAMPGTVIDQLRTHPDWYLSESEGTMAEANQSVSATFADLVETTTTSLGLYSAPPQPDEAEPPTGREVKPPPPTRPSTRSGTNADGKEAEERTPRAADELMQQDEPADQPSGSDNSGRNSGDDDETYQEW